MTGGPKKGDLDLLATNLSCSGSVLTFLGRHLRNGHISKSTSLTYAQSTYRNRGSLIYQNLSECYRYSQGQATHPKKTLINIQLY